MGKEQVIEIVNRYFDVIKKYFPVRKIILYGSYSRDEAKEFSDIDVAVIVEKVEDGFLESEFLLHKLVRDIDLRIEPILFEEGKDPNGFLEEINKNWICHLSKKLILIN